MNRIEQVFEKMNKEHNKALIPYVCCGDPDINFTEQLILMLADSGADLIELGVPYSDPVADGPTIQEASTRALAKGINLEDIFNLVKRIRKKTQVPLIIMTYFNPVYVIGVENFIKKAATVGIDGLIIPDLPVEEAGYLNEVAQRNGINLIFLIAPTSDYERIRKIVNISKGFIYCVSVSGVTGSRNVINNQLESFINNIRPLIKLPLVVGFGISGPDAARKIVKYADGVIIGSALIETINKSMRENQNNYNDVLNDTSVFIKKLKESVTG